MKAIKLALSFAMILLGMALTTSTLSLARAQSEQGVLAQGANPLDPGYPALLRLSLAPTSLLSVTATLRKTVVDGMPTNLLATSDGKVWFTTDGNLGVVNPQSNAIYYYSLPNGGQPWGLTQDQQGAIWVSSFTDNESEGSVLRFVNNNVTAWKHTDLGEVWGLAFHPARGDVWFTSRGDKPGVNRLSYGNPSILNYATTPYTCTYDLAIAPDGMVWVTVQPEGNQGVIRFDPQSKQMTAWDMPIPGSEPFRILAAGADEIWITEAATRTNSLAKLVPSTNRLYEYRIPAVDSLPHGLAVSPPWVWFSAEGSNQIGRLELSSALVSMETLLIPQPLGVVTSTLTATQTQPFISQSSTNLAASESTLTAANSDGFSLFPLDVAGSVPFGVFARTPFEVWFAADGYLGTLLTGERTYLPLLRR